MLKSRSLALRLLVFTVMLAILTVGSVFFRVGETEASARPRPSDTAMTADGALYQQSLPIDPLDTAIATTVGFRSAE